MSRLLTVGILTAIFLCGLVGRGGEPALAQKVSASEATSAQKQKKRAAAKKCLRGPVPPFMRNPRYMNRGFIKRRC
jgi:hypothetical protein